MNYLVPSQVLLIIPFLRHWDIMHSVNDVYDSEDTLEMLLWGVKLLSPLFL